MRVESSGESHNLRDSHFRRRADTRHSLRKLHDERLGGGAVLREVVDGGADFEHSVAHTEHLLHTENVRQLGYGLRGTLAEIDQSHVDNGCRLDILLNRGYGIVAEATALLSEKIKLLAGKAGVHTFENLVEFGNFGGGHTGVLYGVRHLFLHIRV